MSDLVSEKELVDLTDATTAHKQAKVLESAGIFFWFSHKKGIKTTWHHVHSAQNARENKGIQGAEGSYAPDFSKAH